MARVAPRIRGRPVGVDVPVAQAVARQRGHGLGLGCCVPNVLGSLGCLGPAVPEPSARVASPLLVRFAVPVLGCGGVPSPCLGVVVFGSPSVRRPRRGKSGGGAYRGRGGSGPFFEKPGPWKHRFVKPVRTPDFCLWGEEREMRPDRRTGVLWGIDPIFQCLFYIFFTRNYPRTPNSESEKDMPYTY